MVIPRSQALRGNALWALRVRISVCGTTRFSKAEALVSLT